MRIHLFHPLVPAAMLMVGMVLAVATAAEPTAPAATPIPLGNYQSTIQPLLQANCITCHNAKKHKGSVDFSAVTDDQAVRRWRKLWKTAAEQLQAGDMPPDDAKDQPTAEQRARLIAWMKQAAIVDIHDPANRDPGRPIIRRLTRDEYNRTMSDLLGIRFDANSAVGMNDDANASGFNNLAAAMNVSPELMEKYLLAADAALDGVFPPDESAPANGAKKQSDAARGAYDKLAAINSAANPHDAATQILTRFVRRAWRRPATDAEITRIVALFDLLLSDGKSFDQALRMTFKPILASPYFLFRVERDKSSVGDATPYRIDDHELAVRLSYFLWSTMPDDELSSLADAGKLSDPVVLNAQVRRMLKDTRSRQLTDGFGYQWLKLDKLWHARPQTEFFPAYTVNIKNAMREEAVTFFDHLRTDDRPVLDLLDSDYTFLNAELAKFYNIPGVEGDQFRRVDLKPEYHRGGLLGMGAVLSMTSHTFRTSPTQRGKYVLDVIFGTPPPPPPANAGVFKDEKATHDVVTNFRQQLVLHAADPTCAACHRRMDPLGFALDNYDGIGQWRADAGAGRQLDTTGILPNGDKFSGAVELKQVLLKRQDEFVANMIRQMISYATGRETDYNDDAAVAEIQGDLAKSGFRFSALVQGVLNSYEFQCRRNLSASEEAKSE